VSGSGERYVLAIDLGTTSLKVALVSTTGRIAGAATEPQHVTLLEGGGAEQDPEEWWRSVVRATRRVLEETGVAPATVIAVNASVQWSGTVAVDAGGRPLAPAIIWMDSRGAPQAKRLTDGFPRIEGYGAAKLFRWIRKTGGAPTHSGKDPISHILYLREANPELYRATATFLEPKDWLNLRLTGRCVSTFDSITLHWVTDTRDVGRIHYDERLLRMAGLERSKLPDLVPAATVLGTLTEQTATELGLPASVRVVSGAPDLPAAAIGSGAVRDFDAHLCIGTSSWLVCHVPYKKTDLFHNMASLPASIPGRYLLTTEQESAGVCLTYLKEKVFFPNDELAEGGGPEDPYAAFDRLAATVPAGSDRLVFLPWLHGERTPVDDSTIRGGFFNQSLETTRAHMVRAVMEGVAFNSRWLLVYVEKFIKRRLDAITMIGGGAKSDLWCQIHADVLDRPIRQVEQPVLSGTRGAAFQALLALGELTVEDIPALVPIARTYQPDPANRATYDELFGVFRDLYKRTRPLAAKLNAPARAGALPEGARR